MPKKRPDPRKIKGGKFLRELKKIAVDYGLAFTGLTGTHHYEFRNDNSRVIAASTPKDSDEAIKLFRRDCERA